MNPPPTTPVPEPGRKVRFGDAADTNLRQRYGEPFQVSKDGTVTQLNEVYWAALHAIEHELLYEPDEETFYRYSPASGLYAVHSTDALHAEMAARIFAMGKESSNDSLQWKRSSRQLCGIISHLKGIVEVRSAFAKKGAYLHVANGVIVFKETGPELKPFSPRFRSRNASPVVFDPTAKCERFLTELLAPVHWEDVELVQKFAGMFLLGYNRAQRILIFDGEGGTGKTQLANVLQGMVGVANVTQLRTTHLDQRFELYRFIKKKLLVGVDVEAYFLSSKGAAVLKGLVGGDWFDAEQKGGTGSFQMQGLFNVLITSNARLRVRLQGDLSAWRRRLVIVRYVGGPPAKKINDFGAFLIRTEGSGILNWALEGARKVLVEMPDEGGDLMLTERQRTIVDSLLGESDSLRHFLVERVVREAQEDLTATQLLEAYGAYCTEKKWKPLHQRHVQINLESLMLELFCVAKRHDIDREGTEQRGFSGVKLH